MSCPYFNPVTIASKGEGVEPARAPLGGVYEGTCHADPAEPRAPLAAILREYCNFGYGRGHCGNFPRNAEADAVRFSVSASNELIWIFEKDYAPAAHGRLDETGGIVRRQAEVFFENYERQIDRATG
jgi:hypothetical protein